MIDEFDILPDESEGHPPVPVHPDRPMAGEVTLQLMRAKSRDREIGRSLCDVKETQNAGEFRDVRRLHALVRSRLIQSLEALVSEAHDHHESVSRIASRYKRIRGARHEDSGP